MWAIIILGLLILLGMMGAAVCVTEIARSLFVQMARWSALPLQTSKDSGLF